jgi:ABC-2 type transport system permease protein
MPRWIQILTYLLPARYFVQCLQALFLVGNVWEILFKNMAVMLFMSLVLFALISRKLVKRLD